MRLKKVDDLDVIGEVQILNHILEALLLEDVLFMNEYLLKIDLMNLFVGVVYAQLLETIVIEDFKTVDI
jgi:hypothetical protein